jgi:DNA sulfur modification protein DndB
MATKTKHALPAQPLEPLIIERNQLDIAARQRRDPNVNRSIHVADEAEFVRDNWVVVRRGTKAVRVSKPKPHDVLLEDRFWHLCYKMGYPVLSGPRFTLKYLRSDDSIGEKQIDVFAKDDETCLVAECKSRDIRGRRPLQKDIHETIALQKYFSNSIRAAFKDSSKLKILWIYVTENIIWSEQDVDRANSGNIKIVTENDLIYFEAFIGHLGSAGRFQFLAEFLAGQEIPGLNAKVPAVKGAFGPYKFYSFAISPKHLLKIAFVNHQALNHPGSRPAYQRMINSKRIKNIGNFISSGGFFPTNILVNFNGECRFDQIAEQNEDNRLKFGWLYLPNRYKSAWIIDGQHRLYGFSNLEDKYLESTLFVLAFEKLDPQKEADLFITINHEQKSVPKSLLVTLQADLKLGSSDPKEALSALGSAIVRTMANDPTSPFFGRIQTPDVTPQPSQNLTVAEIVKGITRSGLVGRMAGKGQRIAGYLSQATDKKTIDRARRVINGYFRTIMDANPTRWVAGRAEWICVNPGIRAHLLLIAEIVKHLDAKGVIDGFEASEERLITEITAFVTPICSFIKSASVAQLEPKFSRKFGEGGMTEYFYALCEILNAKNKEFGTDEFRQYLARQKDARDGQTRQDVLDLVQTVIDVSIDVLKTVYGLEELASGEKAYWEIGIENSKIKEEAYKKQQMAQREKRLPKEAYLDLVDLDSIFRQKGNWEHFSTIFNIPLEGANPKAKVYNLDWIDKLNERRRTAAHSSAIRGFSEDDTKFIRWLKSELYVRLEQAGRLPDTA